MRWSPGGALVAALVVAATSVVVVAQPPSATAAAADPYTWKNVRIDGGGFIPGIVFNPGEKNLIYARTDIGGAYRWNQTGQSWTPLLDGVGQTDWGHNGVLSIAADPVDTGRVYAAVGMYTNSWDPNNGAILRSTDRGATWQQTDLPFKVGGNMPGRGMGERLAVDPHDNRNVYFAAEGGNGLWRSTDHGVTWARVTAFPNAGNYVQDPADTSGYLAQNQGLTWVTFGAAGQVFVGVADRANPVYMSADSGVTWSRIAGQPTGYLAHKGVVQGDYLYIATSDTGGPYDGGAGAVWKYRISTATWTDISPTAVADRYYGYSGLTVDTQHPGTLMVATQISWWPDAIFFRSTDNGATWTRAWDWTGYPSRSRRYALDISADPWLDFNNAPAAPEESPKLGWMNESLQIDPFDSNRLLYGTGATLYGTTDLTKWDSGGTITIKPVAKGIEETAVLDLASPPSGAPLVSALGDVGGFYHADLDTVPASFHDTPSLGSNTSLDFAELSPSFFVRVGNADAAPHIGVSNDGGKTWYQGQEPAGVSGGGTVAVGADANAVVWSPAGTGVHYSTTRGSSWTASTGVPAGAIVESDRVNPETFYAYAGGSFYTSVDGGASFTASTVALPSAGRLHVKAVPGVAGEVWVAGSTGLLRSTDSGKTFTQVSAEVTAGVNVAFGKAAPGASHPAVFLVGTVDGVDGVYRSDDTGASWVRINDDGHRYGNAGDALAGDPRIYGRVYLGTNGRGILYADRTGATPSAPASPSPSASPSTSPRRPTAGCSASYKTIGSWSGGFQGEVTVANTGASATTGWTVKWAYTAGQAVTQSWGGTAAQSGSAVTVTNASYNGALASGASTTFGFLGSTTGTTDPVPSPVSCSRVP
ncbi:xyloglucanase [Actinoplanes sp. SE50]|uniref:cellulose binding domain-containing protein n=1 Tax=unclassified Actinoplanes TaxID=2626549 RepID=UPI00023EBED1|nr:MULTISPECIES: cellulose binding domain-containing protein [unclassified Actinoplanes]AEV83477.1 endoglucanase, putative [Actinoplanes sp. SE50/110]ATO81870.1 xyloglucanase [Actinoplanes sp. SE50]SLL99278.1 xyloglucanase [Actinoplanes sp. SE50/110]